MKIKQKTSISKFVLTQMWRTTNERIKRQLKNRNRGKRGKDRQSLASYMDSLTLAGTVDNGLAEE